MQNTNSTQHPGYLVAFKGLACAWFKTLLLTLTFLNLGQVLHAQPWSYDFGTGTGTHTSGASTTFFTGTPSGTYRVRVGSGSGSLALVNPGTTLGTGTELQIQAPTGASTTKFGVYDWSSPSNVAYLKTKFRTTSTGNGSLVFVLGLNTTASDNNGYTNHYNNSLGMVRITYASGAISAVERRISGSFSAISSSGFAKDTDHLIEIYANNSGSSTTYTRGGSNTLATRTWDLWVDGVQVVSNAPRAGTLAAGNLNGFTFFAESSTGNAAYIYLDDLEYSNSLPQDITTAQNGPWTTAATWTGGVVPTSSQNVIVSHVVTSGALTRDAGTTTTIGTTGRLEMSATYTNNGTTNVDGAFQLDQGAWATGNALKYGSNGTLIFNNSSGLYGVNNDAFWPTTDPPINVTVQNAGGITMNVARTVTGMFTLAGSGSNMVQGTALTLNGITRINGSNFQTVPTYGSSSLLQYNTTYGTYNEWTGGGNSNPTAGSGVPANVEVLSGTLSLGADRGVPGNVTVNSGATLNLNAGDLYLGGNFTQNGTLTNNNKAVQFVQGNAQTISRTSGSITFDWLVVNKSANNVSLSNAVVVNNTVFLNPNGGHISLGANNLTTGAVSGANAGGYILTGSTGQLMQVVAGSAKIFPVGNAAYNPITLTNSGTSDTYGIRLDDAAPASTNDPAKVLNKTWFVTEAVGGGGDLAVVAQYNSGDARGANYNAAPTPRIGLRTSGTWVQQNSSLAGSNPITSTSSTNFNNTLVSAYFGVGKDDAFLAVAAPPTIGSFTSNPNDGTPTNIYVGSTIVVTGTNFSSVNIVKYGGSGGTTLTPGTDYTIDNNSQITITVPAGFAGALYIENPSGNATGATFVNLGYITAANTTWMNASTWLGGAVPPSAATTDVTIAHNVSNVTASRNVGRLTVRSGQSITINSVNGVLIVNAASTNSGTITLTNGRLEVSNATYTNNGTINIGTDSEFRINQGGFANGSGTYDYSAGGTLEFDNSSGVYGPINAAHTYWPATNGPQNVTILGAGGINMGMARTVPSSGISGNFRLSATAGANSVQGTALTLNGDVSIYGGNFQTTPTYGPSSHLIYYTNYNTSNEWTGGASVSVTAGSGVPANVSVFSGTTNLSGGRGVPGNVRVYNGAELSLNMSAGDLYIAGNLVVNAGGVWSNNNRAVWFVGTGTSVIEAGSGTQYFDYLIISKSSGSVQLDNSPATNVTLNTNSGDILQILDAGTLDLNGRVLTFNNNGGNIYVNGNRSIITSIANAQIVVNGWKYVRNNAGTGTLDFGSSNNFNMYLNHGINFGKFGGIPISNFAGTLVINLNGFVDTNPPVYQANSALVYNSGAPHSNVAEWTGGNVNTVTTGEGIPAAVTIQGSGTNVTLAGARGIPGKLTVSNGATLTLGGDFYTRGNVEFTGTGALNGGNYAFFFCNNSVTQTITSAASLTIPYLVFSPVSGSTTVQINSALNISAPSGGNAISFSGSGDLFRLNNQSLTIGTAGVANAISGAGNFVGSTTSNLTLLGTGSVGTLNFDASNRNLGTLTMNRQNATIGATLGTPLTVNTALYLTAGHIALGNNDLGMANTVLAANHTGSANGFVIADVNLGTGRLLKGITTAANGSLTLHVGDNSAPNGPEYSPATMTFSGGTFTSAYYGVQVADVKHINNDAPTNYITRYWDITRSGTFGGSLNYAFNGTYTSADINGTEASSISGRWNGTSWTTGAALNANTMSITGLNTMPAVNQFSAGDPLMAQEINVRQGVTTYTSGGPAFNFGNVGTGTTSAAITFTIENLGMSNLSITTPLGQGSEFQVATQPGTSVAGGSSTTFTVAFTPAANGVSTGTITIANNDSDENPYILNVTGTGVTPVPYNFANNNRTYVSVVGGSGLAWDLATNWYKVYNRAFQPSPDWPDGNTDVAYLRGNFTLGTSSKAIDSLTIEGTGTLITGSGNYTVQGYLHILNGGTFNFSRLININGVFEVEDGGLFTYSYTNTNSRSSSIWNGVEKFHPNSTFIIYDCQNSAGFYVIENASDISPYPNASGYCFGNFILDKSSGSGPTLFPNGFNNKFAAGDMIFRNAANNVRWYGTPSASNLTTTIGGNIIFENTFNQNVNIMTQTGLGAVNVTVLGNITNNGTGNFSLVNISTASSPSVTFNVDGNITVNSGGVLFNGGTSGSAVTGPTINLKGDLTVGANGLFANMNTNGGSSKGTLNLIGTYNPLLPATIQTIDINSSSHSGFANRNRYINFNLNPTATGAMAQLLNNDLALGSSSIFTVFPDGIMHFGFNGSTALNLTKTSGATGTGFDLQVGGKIFITSPNGIDAGTAAEGNVQTDNRTYNNNATTPTTYHYIGKAPTQRFGDGLPKPSSAIAVIVELEGINTQLLFEEHNGVGYVPMTTDISINTNSPGLRMIQGTLVATENSDFIGANGKLIMTGGIYQTSETTNNVPQLGGVKTLTGGTIELNALGNQVLKGTEDYNSLTFSGSGTKTLTSGLPTASLDTLVTVKDDAILELASNEFSGPAGLTMANNARMRMSQLIVPLPQLDGTNAPYILGGVSTVELYGTGAAQTHSLRGTYGGGTNVSYQNIELNSVAANLSTQNIYMSAGITVKGTMTVYAPTVFRLNPTDIITSGHLSSTFDLQPGATLLYAHPQGIANSGLSGNIRTVTRNFPTTASYGFTGTGDMITGSGLPANVNNLYLRKTVNTNVVTLSSHVTVNGDLVLDAGVILADPYYVTVANTATTAISGGSSTAYISGYLRRDLPANLVSGSSYFFPIGRHLPAPTYLPFTLVNPTTGASGANVRILANNTGSGGTVVPNNSNPLSTTEYWALTATGTFNGSQFTASRPSNAGLVNSLARSTTTASGNYTKINGTPSGDDVVSNSDFSAGNTQFLAMALIVNPTITSGATDICQYGQSTYNTQSGMTNYVWNVVGGSIASGGGSSNNFVTVDWNSSGIRSVSINYTENGYTANSPTVLNVNVNATPSISVTPPPPACAPSTIDITETGSPVYVSDANATIGTYTYHATLAHANAGTPVIPAFDPQAVSSTQTVWMRKQTSAGCSDVESITVTINSCNIVWTGVVNSDWNTPGNWNLNILPTSGHNVFIPSTADLAAQLPVPGVPPIIYNPGLNGFCNDIYFYTGADLTIQSGQTLNVLGNWQAQTSLIIQGEGTVLFNNNSGARFINGSTSFPRMVNNNADVLTINSGMQTFTRVLGLQRGILAGNGRITLASDATNTGLLDNFSLGYNGLLSGNITSNRNIAGNKGYRYLSNPINASSGLTVLAFGPSVSGANGVIYNPSSPPHPSAFPTCWIYNENDANAVENQHPQWGWVSATTAANQLQTMRGYAVIISGAQTLSYTGAPNSGNLNIPITYTVSGAVTYDGSNLVGNPYPSPISWNAILALGGNSGQISNVVKRFSSTTTYTGQYADWNGAVGTNGANDNIALGQGFFIQALSGANNFVMTNNVRRSVPGAGFFEEIPEAPANGILRLKVSGGKGADEAVLYIDHRASDTFDKILDAPKMLGTLEGLPNIYSVAGQQNVSINALSSLVADKIVPLDIVITQAGIHQIEVLELKNFDPSAILLLEDRENGLFHNLKNTNNLSYNLKTGTISGRFFLHFMPGITMSPTAETCKKADGKITLTNPSNSPRKLVVTDANGLIRFEKEAFTGTIIVHGLETGLYNVQLIGVENIACTLEVEIPDEIAVSAEYTASATKIETGQEVHFNANSLTPGVNFNWYIGSTLISSLPSFSYTFGEPGIYPVELRTSKGLCSQSSIQDILVNQGGSGSTHASNASFIKVYPNPANEQLHIELGKGYKEAIKLIEITDAAGRVVCRGFSEAIIESGKVILPVNHLANGAYSVNLHFSSGNTNSRSIMIVH